MRKREPRITAAELLKAQEDVWGAVREIVKLPLREKPIGSFTTDEFAEKFKVCASTARKQLTSLVDAGKLSRVKVLLPGTGVKQWCYSVVKK